MEEIAFQLPYTLDYLATLAWALTGALLAARRGYDILGVAALALVSATGGGLLRDGIFLQSGPPVLVQTPTYILIVLAAALFVQIFGVRLAHARSLEPVIKLIDAVGIGAYAIVGMQLALSAGIDLLGVVLVGVVNAVGGGMLRDIMIRRDPEIFKPGSAFALAALAGCVIFLLLTRVAGMNPPTAAWITIGAVFLLRLTSVYLNLTTRPMPGYTPQQGD